MLGWDPLADAAYGENLRSFLGTFSFMNVPWNVQLHECILTQNITML